MKTGHLYIVVLEKKRNHKMWMELITFSFFLFWGSCQKIMVKDWCLPSRSAVVLTLSQESLANPPFNCSASSGKAVVGVRLIIHVLPYQVRSVCPEEFVLLHRWTTNSHFKASLKSVLLSNICDFFIKHTQNKLTLIIYGLVTNLLWPLLRP